MTKYKLLRDCPHGKKDSVWEQNGDFADWFVLTHEDDIEKIGWFFPKSTFSDWFEEIKTHAVVYERTGSRDTTKTK